jgi:ribosomal protein S18 acetylase RimI-like enzyme
MDMTLSAAENLEIVPVPPRERADALAMVASRLQQQERRQQVETFLAGIRTDQVAPDGLLGAYRGGRLVGAAFSQIQTGKTAIIWPPRCVDSESETTANRLLRTSCAWLAREGVCAAQAMLPIADQSDRATLRAGGFEHVADLLYLVCLAGEFPSHPPQGPLDFEQYRAANHRRLMRIVEATYHETLDCPQLNGVRNIDDVLAGYRATGVFDASRWLIVRRQTQDVGCLLLTDHPHQENWELVYMGVAAPHRGSGWGMHIVRYAQWRAQQAGRPRLVLAVDAANEPAVAIYAIAGFQAWDRRSVYLKVFRRAG